MTTLPRISIITPSYNQGEYIRETIESVLGQGYPDLEYIVVDGGSTDSTLSILKEFGDKIDWISEKDRGQSHAINKGLQKSTGEILGFLNSDDIYEPGALLRVGEFFAKHPKSIWVTGKCRTVNENGEEIRREITLYKNFWLMARSKIILKILNYISQPATFWRRDAIEKVGYFNEKWKFAMDYDFWLRMGKYYHLNFINLYLANFRVHSFSKAGASANAQFDGALDILKSQESSPIIIWLHKMHDALTVFMYSKVFGVEVT
jgi:glycosyltransferase involved in cell wall biosynthesis